MFFEYDYNLGWIVIIISSPDQIDKIKMDGWILYSILIFYQVWTLIYHIELAEKFNINNRTKKKKVT